MPILRPETSTSIEVEASSFSVWNCVITFLQILLLSTVLYGAGWSQGQMYNLAPETLVRFHHFRAIAFFFCVWALQSVALSLLLVWAVGKRNYHLCHSWILSEALMQIFIVVSLVYFAYRSSFVDNSTPTNGSPSVERPINAFYVVKVTPNNIANNELSFRPPKHLAFLLILHFLIKGFGFWIVSRYMKLLKTRRVHVIGDDAEAFTRQSSGSNTAVVVVTNHSRPKSPPPPYAYLCNDDLPCYDEALRLSLGEQEQSRQEQS